MSLHWIGPAGGLGNRILALGSVLALSKLLDTTIIFPWISNSSCNVAYDELFDEMHGIKIDNSLVGNQLFGVNDWEPVTIFREFNNHIHQTITAEEFCISFISAMRSLKFKKSLLNEFFSYYTEHRTHKNLALHIRRTDRIIHHKASLKGILTTDMKKVRYNLKIIRNTGVFKTLQYGLLPENLSRKFEYRGIAKSTIRYLQKQNFGSYTIYADSFDLSNDLHHLIKNMGISDQYYIPGYCIGKADRTYKSDFGKRETSIQDAMIELLGMSKSSGIIQNNSASTFSLCSAIIGQTPILSSKPRHQFWKTIKKTLGKYPNEVSLE